MKIAYWNMLNSEEKQTDHYAAIGIMLALAYKKKTVLMENDYDSESLEWIFKGIKRFYYVKEDTNYFLHRNGFDKLITEMHGKSPSSQVLESSTVELINDYLYYIPQSKVINHLAYEYEMYHQMQDIIQRKQEFQYLFFRFQIYLFVLIVFVVSFLHFRHIGEQQFVLK